MREYAFTDAIWFDVMLARAHLKSKRAREAAIHLRCGYIRGVGRYWIRGAMQVAMLYTEMGVLHDANG